MRRYCGVGLILVSPGEVVGVKAVLSGMTIFFDPAVILWLLLLVLGGVGLARRPRWLGMILVLLAAGWWLVEVTGMPRRLLAGLEEAYVGTARREGPQVDAIVVLGGGAALSTNDFSGLDFGVAADRILTGIDLAHRRQGRMLVLGGSTNTETGSAPEPGLYRAWLKSWDLDSIPLLDLGPCRNTRDEAVRAAELADEHGWTRLLLVTSATHMRRSEGAFRAVGLEVEPVACDFIGMASMNRRISWVPQSMSFVMLQLWLREVVGYRYYRARGWA